MREFIHSFIHDSHVWELLHDMFPSFCHTDPQNLIGREGSFCFLESQILASTFKFLLSRADDETRHFSNADQDHCCSRRGFEGVSSVEDGGKGGSRCEKV